MTVVVKEKLKKRQMTKRNQRVLRLDQEDDRRQIAQ